MSDGGKAEPGFIKRRNRISGQFRAHMIEMLESPAWKALSLAGRRVIDRIEIELAHHAGNDNGRLPVTKLDFAEYGIYPNGTASAVHLDAAIADVSGDPDHPPHRKYSHAVKGYDEHFERVLADAIIEVIARESHVTDVNACVIRTGETASALVTVLTTMLAMSPDMHVPSHLRQAVEQISKRIRRDVSREVAKGTFDKLGACQFRGRA